MTPLQPLNPNGKSPDIREYVIALEKRVAELEKFLVANPVFVNASTTSFSPTQIQIPNPKPLPSWASGYTKPEGPRVKKISDKLYAIDGYTKLTENFNEEDWKLVEREMGIQAGAEEGVAEGSQGSAEDAQGSN